MVREIVEISATLDINWAFSVGGRLEFSRIAHIWVGIKYFAVFLGRKYLNTNTMKKMYPAFTCFLCLFSFFSSTAQERQFLIPDAEVLFSKRHDEIFNELANRNYSLIRKDGDIFEYRRTTPLGYFDLSILFSKSRKLRAIVWQEHIVYANTVALEVQNGGYTKDEATQLPGTDIVLNRGRNLKILVTPHPETNTISLNMQVLATVSTLLIKPGSKTKPKAVFHGY